MDVHLIYVPVRQPATACCSCCCPLRGRARGPDAGASAFPRAAYAMPCLTLRWWLQLNAARAHARVCVHLRTGVCKRAHAAEEPCAPAAAALARSLGPRSRQARAPGATMAGRGPGEPRQRLQLLQAQAQAQACSCPREHWWVHTTGMWHAAARAFMRAHAHEHACRLGIHSQPYHGRSTAATLLQDGGVLGIWVGSKGAFWWLLESGWKKRLTGLTWIQRFRAEAVPVWVATGA